jgi:hypothetical protein
MIKNNSYKLNFQMLASILKVLLKIIEKKSLYLELDNVNKILLKSQGGGK